MAKQLKFREEARQEKEDARKRKEDTQLGLRSSTANPAGLAAGGSMAQDLTEVLSAAKLSQYEHALRELGCALPADLGHMEEADLMGMKKMEVKRLFRAASEYM